MPKRGERAHSGPRNGTAAREAGYLTAAAVSPPCEGTCSEGGFLPSGATYNAVRFFILDTLVTTERFNLYLRQLKNPFIMGNFSLHMLKLFVYFFQKKVLKKDLLQGKI